MCISLPMFFLALIYPRFVFYGPFFSYLISLTIDTMHSFWIYWTFTIPLTLFIVSLWRAWWVNQDRYFRRHLR